MNIQQVFVQSEEGVPFDEAFHKAWNGFQKRRVRCQLVEASEIEDGSLPLNKETLVVGGIGSASYADVRGIAGVAAVLLGDVNCDQVVNLLDVGPFVETLVSAEFNTKADINRDGVVNLLDVSGFVNLIAGN